MRYRHIYVLGVHPLALGYYNKITRARGSLHYADVFCVGDNPDPETAARIPRNRIIGKKPHEFITGYILDPARHDDRDIVVPDHTARHVLMETFLELGQRQFPNRAFQLTPLDVPIETPFVHRGENGALIAMSYATWTCPPDCDEPAECPHIKDARDWDFFKSLPEILAGIAEPASRHIFACRILVDEIAHIPLAQIRREAELYRKRIAAMKKLFVAVATHSHCHGIIGGFSVASAV